jgi:anaerobic nitric oxide reductase transcription regulator
LTPVGTAAAAHDAVATAAVGATLRQAVIDLQRRMIEQALTCQAGNWAGAARQLGLDRGNLQRLARRLGLK